MGHPPATEGARRDEKISSDAFVGAKPPPALVERDIATAFGEAGPRLGKTHTLVANNRKNEQNARNNGLKYINSHFETAALPDFGRVAIDFKSAASHSISNPPPSTDFEPTPIHHRSRGPTLSAFPVTRDVRARPEEEPDTGETSRAHFLVERKSARRSLGGLFFAPPPQWHLNQMRATYQSAFVPSTAVRTTPVRARRAALDHDDVAGAKVFNGERATGRTVFRKMC
jgi:hypothetical protein